jgi:hypothetical protein
MSFEILYCGDRNLIENQQHRIGQSNNRKPQKIIEKPNSFV